METLPNGFTYVSSASADGSLKRTARMVSFVLLGENESLTYTVNAPSTDGSVYSFSGESGGLR